MVDDAGDCDGAGEKSKGVKVSILFFENSALNGPDLDIEVYPFSKLSIFNSFTKRYLIF